MFGQICPHCKQRIRKDAIVCRYCGRDIDPPIKQDCISPNWVFAAFAGLAAGTAFALIFGYWNERRRWQDEIGDFSLSDELDTEGPGKT